MNILEFSAEKNCRQRVLRIAGQKFFNVPNFKNIIHLTDLIFLGLKTLNFRL